MADKERLSPRIDLVPGDPGWSPPPQPDCYETPEKFAFAWEALKAEEPDIETRMRQVRRDHPLASGETMHTRIGPGPLSSRRPSKKRLAGA